AAVETREHNGYRIRTYNVRPGSGSRDVACNADGTVWFCGQRDGTLNLLDPRDGGLKVVALGQGAAPHGVIVGPDGAAWVTEGGQNSIARVDPKDHKVQLWKLNGGPSYANLHTLGFDKQGPLWFTGEVGASGTVWIVDRRGTLWFSGEAGAIGRFEPKSEKMQVWDAPRGYGPYGIALTPQGTVWYVWWAATDPPQLDLASGTPRSVEPPTPQQGARRVWSDSQGRLWISEWNRG